jgi:sugar lactone lactonase YvrE
MTMFRPRALVLGFCALSLLLIVPARNAHAAGYTISTAAGSGPNNVMWGSDGGDGGPATQAGLNAPTGVAVDSAGNLYIVDWSGRIRKVMASTGIVFTVAGRGQTGYSGDGGQATSALLGGPGALAIDAYDNVYYSDVKNFRIRKITARTGIITTIAGNGSMWDSGDGGLAINAGINGGASGIAVDLAGNVYFTNGGDRVRKVSAATGVITTIAGSFGTAYSGDGRSAVAAQIAQPAAVAVDSAGNLYIAARGEHRIRKVHAASGIITTIAGASTGHLVQSGPFTMTSYDGGFSGDGGPATRALLNSPEGLAVDKAGNIYISDTWNYRVRKIDASTGIIETIAGTGVKGFSMENGPATSAQITFSCGIAVNTAGRVYFADQFNHRIRALTPTGATPVSQRALAHVAAGGTWTTGIVVMNTGIQPGKFSIAFRDDYGNPLSLPFKSGPATALTGTVVAQGSMYFEAGNPQAEVKAGWGQIDADPSILVHAVFRNRSSGGLYYEAGVASSAAAREIVIPFDATTFEATGAPFYTGLAIANVERASAAPTCTARDSSGIVIPNAVLLPSLNPLGHYSGYMYPALTGKRGTITCTSNTNLAATAFRFIGNDAFSSLPVVTSPVAGSSSGLPRALAHFAVGDTWTTGIVAVNTASQPAGFSIFFYDDRGNPAVIPFGSGPATILSGTIPGRGSAYFEASDPRMPLTAGWGRIDADPLIVFLALFRNNSTGETYYEAGAPWSVGGKEFVLAFDATTFAATGAPFYTGFALANMEQGQQAFVTCTARDPAGNIIPDAVTVPVLDPLAHYSGFMFPALTGKQGTLYCISNATVAATAFRFMGTSAFSSLPIAAK